MNPPTPRQTEVFLAIRQHLLDHHRAPTLAEICRVVGLASRNAAFKHIRGLIKRGLLRPSRGDSGRAVYLPYEPEVIVRPTGYGTIRIVTTGVVELSPDDYRQWLAEQIEDLDGGAA